MEVNSIIHRPLDHYAYVSPKDTVHIMIQTKKGDCGKIELVYGDPYDWIEDTWQSSEENMKLVGTDLLFDYWKIEVKPTYRRLRYGFRLADQDESLYFGEGGFSEALPSDIAFYFAFPFVHASDAFQAPPWVKDTVWYQIFPERFANGCTSNDPETTLLWGEHKPTANNFFGGDLQGVIDHISYLKELGITGIYFTPIFKAYSNHKYDTIDYLEIDPHFGDKETLKKLIKTCHANGIKVMFDAVFNHAGFYFPQFQDVLENGDQSKYKDWFHIKDFPLTFEPRPNYDTFAFTPNMPKLNTQNKEVREYLLQVGRYWVEEFDIDGWRLDVANEVDHAFWRDFRQTIKSIKPDVYILGEIWHDAMPWLRGDQFDAVMNYPFTRNILDLFAYETLSPQSFIEKMTKVIYMYPSFVNENAFNLVGSHDTARILNECGQDKDRLRQIFTFLLTFIGTPCIYYGDEIGMTGGADPGCRKCMIWDEEKQDQALLNDVKQLIALRKQYPLLANEGTLSFLPIDEDAKYIGFAKENTDEKIIVLFNTADEPTPVSLLDDRVEGMMIDLLSNKQFNDPRLTLEAKGSAIIKITK